MAELNRNTTKANNIRVPFGTALRTCLKVAAIVLMVLTIGLIWRQFQGQVQPQSPSPDATQINVAWQDFMEVSGMFADLSGPSDEAEDGTQIMANPLQREIESLTHEAEAVADFLFTALMIDS